MEDTAGKVAAPARRIGKIIAAGRSAMGKPAANAEDVLWDMWSASGLQRRWVSTAVAGGPGSAVSDRNLDAMVALFDAAARYVDRMPGAGPGGFLEYLRDQQIPADTLHTGRPTGAAVTVLTAHAAKGLEWDVVAVAGVQDGVWPDVRERGSLLGIETLVDVMADRDERGSPGSQAILGNRMTSAVSAVTRTSARLAEERRLFYVAITRARLQLIVTAVTAEDDQPSRFLDELEPSGTAEAPSEREVEQVGRSLDLPSIVAELRQIVCDPVQSDSRRQGAAWQLARLVDEGVTQADPGLWYGYRQLSVADPLGEPDRAVRISPSKVEEFNRCELRWLLKACGATDLGRMAASVGSVVHDLGERAAKENWSKEEMLAELDRVWPSIDVGEGWAAAKEQARAREMVERLATWMASNPRRLVGAELAFDVVIDRAQLVGRVDRLEADDEGRLVVVDLKTGKSAPTNDQVKENAQLATYQLAVECGGFDMVSDGARRSGGASLVQLGKPGRGGKVREQFQPPLADAEDPKWAQNLVADTAERMSRPTFRAQTGAWCGFCPARPSCPAWPEGEQVTP